MEIKKWLTHPVREYKSYRRRVLADTTEAFRSHPEEQLLRTSQLGGKGGERFDPYVRMIYGLGSGGVFAVGVGSSLMNGEYRFAIGGTLVALGIAGMAEATLLHGRHISEIATLASTELQNRRGSSLSVPSL